VKRVERNFQKSGTMGYDFHNPDNIAKCNQQSINAQSKAAKRPINKKSALDLWPTY
jgi:hypothetical protein